MNEIRKRWLWVCWLFGHNDNNGQPTWFGGPTLYHCKRCWRQRLEHE
jgi:hypothetical protein